MRTFVFVGLILFFIVSCTDKNKVPKGIIALPKMREVIWDMACASEFLNSYVLNKDSVDKWAESSKMYGDVLEFHNINEQEFRKSYDYYREHTALMKIIIDSLTKRQITAEELIDKKPVAEEISDTIKFVDTAVHIDSKRKKIREMLPAE